jgi:uncharacterized DUF497 family protein
MADDHDPDEIEVEWDTNKETINRKKHGLGFYEAATVFFDPLSLTVPDDEHSIGEQRHNILGESEYGDLLVVTFTERGTRLRIISARYATKREKKEYEENH